MSAPVGIEASTPSRLTRAPGRARHRVAPTVDPLSVCVAIFAIRPTQITVGRREVEEKRRRYRAAIAAGDRPPPHGSIPVVLGPNTAVFALDRHHWLCALLAEGASEVDVHLMDDLSRISHAAFWRVLDGRGWCHPYGARGQRLGFDAIPSSIEDLQDDPFRSLAGALRRKGGFAKNRAPFSEFQWADFLRGQIDPAMVAEDFDRALAAALELARLRVPVNPTATRGVHAVSHMQVV